MTASRLAWRTALAAIAVLIMLVPTRPAGAQAAPTLRFEITAVGDSTIEFSVRDQPWVKAHLRGIAVDPRRRDMLVAQFEVLRVRDGVATALITGATTRVSVDHVAQLAQPPRPWWRAGSVWVAALVGLGAGLALGAGL